MVSFSSMARSLSESGLSQVPSNCVWRGSRGRHAKPPSPCSSFLLLLSSPARRHLSSKPLLADAAQPVRSIRRSFKCETSLGLSSHLSTISTASIGAANIFFPFKMAVRALPQNFITKEQQAKLAIKGAKPPSDQVQRGGATTHHTTNTEGKLVWNRV